MKNVIKVFVAIAVMGVMTVSAFAQGAGPGGQKGAPGAPGGQKGGQKGGGGMRRMDMDVEILAKMNLTNDQKAKVKAAKDTRNSKFQELMKSMGGPGAGGPGAGGAGKGGAGKGGAGAGKPGAGFAGMREKAKPIQDAYMASIKGILTPPQFAAYEKGVKEAREKMRAQFGGGKGAPGGPGAGEAGKGKGKGKGGSPPPTA